MTDLSNIPHLAERKELQAIAKLHDDVIAQRDAELDAVEAKWQPAIDAEVAKLSPKAREMWDGWSNGDVCGKTSIPIVDGDEVLVDEGTGEAFLRAALDLPPSHVVDADGDEIAV